MGKSHLTTLLQRITLAYVVFISAWLVLRLIFFDRFWPLALVNTAAEYLFVPLPLMAVAMIAVNQWRLLAGLAIPAIAFVASNIFVGPQGGSDHLPVTASLTLVRK